jgi:hypothetical protein
MTDQELALVKQGISLAGTVLGVIVPGGQIAGFAVNEVVSVAEGLADSAPSVVAAFNDAKAAADGGAAPTPEQIAALKASVDAADDTLQADVRKLDEAGQ